LFLDATPVLQVVQRKLSYKCMGWWNFDNQNRLHVKVVKVLTVATNS